MQVFEERSYALKTRNFKFGLKKRKPRSNGQLFMGFNCKPEEYEALCKVIQERNMTASEYMRHAIETEIKHHK